MDSFLQLAAELHSAEVRFLVIGVAAANYYAQSGGSLFVTSVS